MRALALEMEERLPKSNHENGKSVAEARKLWRQEITQSFRTAAEDLEGVTTAQILDEIQRYRADRRKTPEITVHAILQQN